MTTDQKKFVDNVAEIVNKYKSQYSIAVTSPIVAQAIIESGWGKSALSANYHNYFGLKAGSKWTGKSVNMKTKEEVNGNVVNIKDNFRVYDSLEEGIKGYFDFINTTRYSNLKNVKDPKEYLTLIWKDEYCTSSDYVDQCYKVITTNNLTVYDKVSTTQTTTKTVTKNPTPIVKKSMDVIVTEVLNGIWGNGADRKKRLEEAGYNYADVQKNVSNKVNTDKLVDAIESILEAVSKPPVNIANYYTYIMDMIKNKKIDAPGALNHIETDLRNITVWVGSLLDVIKGAKDISNKITK